MKFTTTTLLAGLAAGAVADSQWESWSSSANSTSKTSSTTKTKDGKTSTSTTSKPASLTSTYYCPTEVTSTVTKTESCADVTTEVYATTMTVTAPDTKTVTVYADGKTAAAGPWEAWTASSSSSKPATPTSLPAGCVPKISTTTKVEYVKKAGSTTTITGSTLFVGDGHSPKTTITITATGSAPTWGSGSGWGSDSGSGSSWGSGSGSGGDSASSDKVIATGSDAFKWTVEPAAPVKTHSSGPVYTQLPNGGWGTDNQGWDEWKNSTKNATVPEPGSPASNVTKPFAPLADSYCNKPGSRSSWCGGKNIQSDYYEDYFTGETKYYDWTITNTTQNYDGDEVLALAVNGQVPGPAIEVNWGDIVVIRVHNQLERNGTAIHWHGIRQVGTNDQDGVPGITECPIAPGETRTYTWHASSYGTSWYHSHWATQYADGVFGPMIIHGPATADYDVDAGVVQVTDTFPVTGTQWNDVIAHTGPQGTSNYLLNGHNTKADLSSGQHSLWKVQKGKKYLFRFINSAAQNMFSIAVDSHKMKVIAADFVPINPYETEWLNIGIGQRFDVVIEMDQAVDSYFLRAVTQLACPSACNNTGLAQANGIIAYEGVNELPYQLPTSTTTKTLADFGICADEPLASMVPALSKPAGSSASFKAQASTLPAGGVNLVASNDNGNVFRWFINSGFIDVNYTQPTLMTLADKKNVSLISNPITLNEKNQWVYFVIQNQFFAAHPMHLHGHDFSVLGQGQGTFDASDPAFFDTLNFENPMRRDTAMLMGGTPPGSPVVVPAGYTVIGFETDNPGAWLMHCHIAWHVDGGLALQWLERPDEIKANEYVDAEFRDRCSAYATYEAQSPDYRHGDGYSGLKRRASPFFDEQVAKLNMGQFDSVVRRSTNAEKRYLDNHALKRGIGHSRHFR